MRENRQSLVSCVFIFVFLCFAVEVPTTELSDAGGPARPYCQLTWPARVRSGDFVSWPDIGLVLHEASRRQIRTMWQLPDVPNC